MDVCKVCDCGYNSDCNCTKEMKIMDEAGKCLSLKIKHEGELNGVKE